MKISNHKQVVALHQMWETFNTEPILKLVADEIHFKSQWVSRPIDGKKQFIDYIESRLLTIKASVDKGKIQIHSSIGHIEGQVDEYFILLYYTIRESRFEVLIRVSVDNDLIVKMTVETLKKRFNIKPMDETTYEINKSSNN